MIFADRHIGLSKSEQKEMLAEVGVSSIDELVEKTVPSQIRLTSELDLEPAMSETEYLNHAKALAGSKSNSEVNLI